MDPNPTGTMDARDDDAPARRVVPIEPVALVGVGCRFPGGVEDPRGFWDLIASGTDAVGDIPPDRWRADAFYDPDPATPGRMTVRQGGFLDRPVDRFDAGFFGMPPREAAALDPQQRLLLEVTWEAFEDAGIPLATTAGRGVGVYLGGFTFDAATYQLSDANRHLVGTATPTGVSMTMLAARLSYTFDWHGPSLTVDTACSSSLVAFHHACAALSRGECEVAVAGGVNVMVNPVTTILMSKGQFLSPDGRSKSFDHRADGYARGEGAGVVVLKPLAAAERDGDRVYAVVRGTAVNQDGRTPGITVPSARAQRAVIRQACRSGGVDPASVGYYEAHGTGTAVGDPIEATAIGEVLGGSDRTHWIGSVKSNIGHTEAAAGIAGVIKASLCLERGLVPPNLHFERPNPRIPFDRLPLRVPTGIVPFPDLPGPRRAGVNSFGFGGTNAHAILEQAPQAPTPADEEGDDGRPHVLPLSARSPEALRALVARYADLLEGPDAPALGRLCRAASRQRDHHPLRTSVVAVDVAGAVAELRRLEPAPRRATRGGVAFVYTGMGPQWWGMGRELLRTEPRFAEVVAECDAVLARFGLSIADELLREEDESRLTETLHAQVANFVVQAGLTALWRAWGVEPSAVVGHSVGEVAAAYAAGVYSLPDALTVAFHRARLQAGLAGRGAMVAVGLAADAVEAYLVDGVEVAAVNSATATTLAGDPDAVEEVSGRLRAAGASVTPLRVDVAYHSRHMDELREPLLTALSGIEPREARVPLVSTVTGDRVTGVELDAAYWWENVRRPVRFAAALRRLLSSAPAAVVEVGPHPVLAAAIDEGLSGHGDVVRVASLRRDRPQRRQLLEALGALYAAGVDPDWEGVHPGPREHLDLPRYPWQREHHWVESAAAREARLGGDGLRLAGRAVPAVDPTRDVELSESGLPYLADHRIGDTVIFPGSGYLEAALALFPDDEPCFFEDVVFQRPLALQPRSVTTLRVAYDPGLRLVTLHSREQGDDAGWTSHGRMRRPEVLRPRPAPRRAETVAESTRSLPGFGRDEVYALLDRSDLTYGPAFRGVERLWFREATGEVFAEIRVDVVDAAGHRLHPALLDAALQAVIAGSLRLSGEDGVTYVPARIAEFRFHRSPGRTLWLHGRDRRATAAGRLECDLTLFTDDGEVVAEVIGLRAQRLVQDGDGPSARPGSLYYEHVWRAEPLERSGEARGSEAQDSEAQDSEARDSEAQGSEARGTEARDSEARGSWVVVGSSPVASGLAAELTARGGAVLRTSPDDEDWLDQVRAGVGSPCRGVVYVNGTERDDGAACASVASPLRLVQALTDTAAPLVLVTSGAQSATPDDHTTDPFSAALWGFGRVVGAERPDLRCRLVDVTPETPAGALADELTHPGLDEVVLRGGARHVRRLERAGDRSALHHVTSRAGEIPVRLGASGPGVEGLRFAAAARREPGPTEVEVEVSFVGLNFKDVLKVTGLLSPEAVEGSLSRQALGLECSGVVVRVGEAVADLRPGDEVFVHGADLFASHVTVDAVRVVRKPSTLSLAQAASLLPVVTAHQALTRLARVRPGERVLVHSAAGGVGLAAVRIASRLGARVYATAGSDERREFLRREGVAGVSDSRSTTFADDVLRWTGGEGVDVVVNSLSGELLRKSLGLLRPFGRFVELGKADIAADHSLGLAPFHRALSFHAFDYDRMMLLDPDLVRASMLDVAALHEDGAIDPLPVTEVPAGRVDVAFRALTRGDHVGKVVVGVAGEQVPVPASSLPGSPIRPDGAYVVTGGLGGLGLVVAGWLADRGARHLVLVGRRGVATAEAERAVAELTGRGVEVRVERVDVADRDAVERMFAVVREQLPPVRGVVHAAADFDDVVLADTDAARLVTATRPKADGAWHLHLATQADDLDFFVLFSSVAAQLGAAAAGAYATANEFLNALARHRALKGLPAIAVGWGMVDEVGVAVGRDGAVGDALRRNGHVGMSPARLVAELEALLRTRPVEVSVADVDWSRWARANPQLARLPRYEDLVPADAADGDAHSTLAQRLHDVTAAERLDLLSALVTPLLQRTTGLTGQQLADEQAVDIDSLVAVELRVGLQNALGVSVPAVKLQRNLTVRGLVDLLAEELDRAPSTPSRPAEGITAHEFTSADGLVVHGHLSLPDGPGPHPAVVVCTSGEGGALDDQGRYARVSEHGPLLAAGFAVFTVDQRGAPGHGAEYRALAEMGGRDIDDVVAAARHLAGLPGIDPARLSVLGTSRGAYSALLALAREPSLWRRAVLIMGLYDPALLVDAERSRPGALLTGRPEVGPDEVEAHFADPRRQPLAGLDAVEAPLLLVHGDADAVVPVSQAVDLVDRARRSGLPARLVAVPGLGHDHDHADEAWTALWPQVADFLGEVDR